MGFLVATGSPQCSTVRDYRPVLAADGDEAAGCQAQADEGAQGEGAEKVAGAALKQAARARYLAGALDQARARPQADTVRIRISVRSSPSYHKTKFVSAHVT
jgi:hypothetical protein